MRMDATFNIQDLIMQAANGRSFSPEEMAARVTGQTISVGDRSHEVIRAQAQAFRKEVQALITKSMHEMVESERNTIAQKLTQAGHPELVSLLRN